MSEAALISDSREVIFDEIFPHTPDAIWKALTSGELIDQWLMKQTGFEPRLGNRFVFQTSPTADWDGQIHCEILELVPRERLAFSWKSGSHTSSGYMPRLDTVVTWTLAHHDNGTRLRLVHSGFVMPKDESTYKNISRGWPTIVPKLMAIAAKFT